MKGSTKLSVAIALALIGGNAFALGLGAIQVKSKLNQPLDAEIQVLSENAADTAGLDIKLATAEDFQRVGLDRGRIAIPLDFAVSTNSRGQSVIRVTSKDAVREPLLDFLVEVNWAKGKLLREYTVLMDPPVTAPTRTAAAPVPVREAPAAQPAAKIAAEPPKSKPTPTRVKPPRPVAEAKPEKAAPPPPPKPKAAPAPHAAANGEYGPVAEGETLTEIARSTRPDDATNLNEMMLALLKANPNAFYKDNINALKRGAVLRIPSRDDVKASGSVAEAAAAVHDQNQAWITKAPVAKPTVVATTGTPKKTPEPAAAKPAPAKAGEHLALVPPAAGKGGQGATDRPGTASGTAGGTESKAELARVRETLASREQEVSELKSRVKDLEKINDDDRRLLSLRQNEVADLQKKLKELEAKAASAAATASTAKPATTSPAPTPATMPAKPVEAPAANVTKPVEPAKPAEAGKAPSNLTAKDIWGNISAGEQPKPGTPATSTPPASTTPVPTASSTTPATSATATSPSAPAATPPVAKPEETKPTSTATPLKPTIAPKVAPIAPPAAELPWWQKPEYLYGGGIGLLLIGLLAFTRLMRKPKAELPVVPVAEHVDAVDEEHQLLDELHLHPGDPQLSLQLLSLYYANRDAYKFEAAAETMYAHIADPTQPEWLEVRRMGEDLVPHNPLFGGQDDIAQAAGTGWPHHEHVASEHAVEHSDAETHAMETRHDQDFDLGQFDTHAPAKPAPEESFDFDLTDHTATAATSAHPTPPPPAYTPPPAYVPPPAPKPAAPMPAAAPMPPPPPPAPKPAEDFFAGEDAIGTKLDLAKAYLDMGDPEGARSMLDEVMSEGNDAQKSEARKLLAEIK